VTDRNKNFGERELNLFEMLRVSLSAFHQGFWRLSLATIRTCCCHCLSAISSLVFIDVVFDLNDPQSIRPKAQYYCLFDG
jgi:hypothetical protein